LREPKLITPTFRHLADHERYAFAFPGGNSCRCFKYVSHEGSFGWNLSRTAL
jgi:hypothetical protein